MIIRSRREHNYTIVANEVLEHTRLSFAAKGLLAYLLSRPDNWSVSYRQLATVGCDGEHTTRRLLRELEVTGYLVRVRTRDEAQQIQWVSTVYDTPQAGGKPGADEPADGELGDEEPCGDFPCGDSSGMEEPGVGNPGVEKSGVGNPGTENPGMESPGTESPGVEEPGVGNPGVEEPGTGKTAANCSSSQEPCGENPCGDSPCGDLPCGGSPGVADRRRISTVRTITTTKATTRASSPDGEGPPPKPAIFDASLNDAQAETRAEPAEIAPSVISVTTASGSAVTANPPSEHEQLFGAVCWLIGWESVTLAKEQRSQVAQTVDILKRAGYGIDDLRRFWRDVWLCDWRWRKEKARPTLTVLRAEIGKLRVDERDLEGDTRGENQPGRAAVNAELREQLREAKRRRAAAHSAGGEGIRLPRLQGQDVGLPGRADERPTLRQGVSLPLSGAGGPGQAVPEAGRAGRADGCRT